MTSDSQPGQQEQARERQAAAEESESKARQPYLKPKLTYVAPKLVKHGEVNELTGFFGPFSPPD